MEIESRNIGNVTILKPFINTVNAETCEQFKLKISEFVDQRCNIVLDLSEVDFMDSKGIGCLISILKMIEMVNGKISICGVKPQLLNIFNLARLVLFFNIKDTETESINFLSNNELSKNI